MAWGHIDDSAHSHPKFVAAGLAATGAYFLSISWSNAHGTDGFIPCNYGRAFGGAVVKMLTSELIPGKAPLWEAVEGGYVIHDFLDEGRNKPAAYWDERRAEIRNKRREAGQKGAANRWGDGKRDGKADSKSHGKPDGKTDGPVSRIPVNSPSDFRPDVEELCSVVADLVTANGFRNVEITTAWRRHARLLLDTEGVTLSEALRVARWATADTFWRSNIRGVPKFREQYESLRLKADAVSPVAGRPRMMTVAEALVGESSVAP